MNRPSITGILETALHVEDVARSMDFYDRLFGFEKMASADRFCAYAVPGRDVFLLFKKGGTLEPVATAGGMIPTHDGSGRLHLAFAIPLEELTAWEERLKQLGIDIESKVHWQEGGWSLYFRDPDQHCLELATPGTWPNF